MKYVVYDSLAPADIRIDPSGNLFTSYNAYTFALRDVALAAIEILKNKHPEGDWKIKALEEMEDNDE